MHHPLMEKSKLELALRAAIKISCDKGVDVKKSVEKLLERDRQCSEEQICNLLQKDPEVLEDKELVKKLWFAKTFRPRVLESIFEKWPQLFVDEVEDFLIEWLKEDLSLGILILPQFIESNVRTNFCAKLFFVIKIKKITFRSRRKFSSKSPENNGRWYLFGISRFKADATFKVNV